MATVFIPSMLRPLAAGKEAVTVGGSTVGEIVRRLTERYPGLGDRLLQDGQIPANISVAIDGEVSTLGVLDSVEQDSEIHFVPAIAGGLGGAHA